MSNCTKCNQPMKQLFTSEYCDCENKAIKKDDEEAERIRKAFKYKYKSATALDYGMGYTLNKYELEYDNCDWTTWASAAIDAVEEQRTKPISSSITNGTITLTSIVAPTAVSTRVVNDLYTEMFRKITEAYDSSIVNYNYHLYIEPKKQHILEDVMFQLIATPKQED